MKAIHIPWDLSQPLSVMDLDGVAGLKAIVGEGYGAIELPGLGPGLGICIRENDRVDDSQYNERLTRLWWAGDRFEPSHVLVGDALLVRLRYDGDLVRFYDLPAPVVALMLSSGQFEVQRYVLDADAWSRVGLPRSDLFEALLAFAAAQRQDPRPRLRLALAAHLGG